MGLGGVGITVSTGGSQSIGSPKPIGMSQVVKYTENNRTKKAKDPFTKNENLSLIERFIRTSKMLLLFAQY
jgi:hypothetical protein